MFKNILLINLIITSFLSFFGCSHKATDPEILTKKVTLSQGSTLDKSLSELSLSNQSRHEITSNLRKLFNPRYSKPGDYYEIAIDTDAIPSWHNFSYFPQDKEYYRIIKSSHGTIAAEKLLREITISTISARGTIKTSLWEAMAEQNVDPDIILDFADIFAWQIDFLTEPRTGDTFKLIYEKTALDNGKALGKQILGAQYNLGKKNYTAILFQHPDGKKGYYSLEGKSVISAFLKAPLQYRRISSYFTKARYHPILKYYRPHMGIDYAAPEGTPISSIGEGKVVHAGWKGDNGNLVGVQHSNGYSSFYGHLSRIAKGVKIGNRVSQGQVIGFVGSTGLSTGPHLDFRVKKYGQFINYLKMKIPPAKSIKKSERESFENVKKGIFRQFAQLNYM